ncbi:MAG: hypothetical protein SFW35_11035 [Chitinophagales bacterium]|nr:hypothetical protein [Chitinophagales bacterium]
MKTFRFIAFQFVLILMMVLPSMAQCPMCKASVESSMKDGSTVALGLNAGILYLLVMPYLAFSILFFLWYRSYKRNKAA